MTTPSGSSSTHKRIPSTTTPTNGTHASSPAPAAPVPALVPASTPPSKPKVVKKKPLILPPLPLATDRASLRAQYDSCYVRYSALWARVVAERHRQEMLLKGVSKTRDDVGGSEDESASSVEDVEELRKSYNRLHERLIEIRGLLER